MQQSGVYRNVLGIQGAQIIVHFEKCNKPFLLHFQVATVVMAVYTQICRQYQMSTSAIRTGAACTLTNEQIVGVMLVKSLEGL